MLERIISFGATSTTSGMMKPLVVVEREHAIGTVIMIVFTVAILAFLNSL